MTSPIGCSWWCFKPKQNRASLSRGALTGRDWLMISLAESSFSTKVQLQLDLMFGRDQATKRMTWYFDTPQPSSGVKSHALRAGLTFQKWASRGRHVEDVDLPKLMISLRGAILENLCFEISPCNFFSLQIETFMLTSQQTHASTT